MLRLRRRAVAVYELQDFMRLHWWHQAELKSNVASFAAAGISTRLSGIDPLTPVQRH